MSTAPTRKLAAVMFTDIPGYAGMVKNGEEVLQRVQIHREVLEEAVSGHQGKVISFYGDGSLATFTSAIDAVNCAIAMQNAYIEASVPVRIGLHLGDIVFKDDSVFGDGVNVASRIQAQGVAGSILLSDKLQQEIVNHVHIKTRPLGSRRLKNVKRPVRIFAVANDNIVVPRSQRFSLKSSSLALIIALVVAALAIYFANTSGVFGSSGNAFEEIRGQRVAVRFQDYAKLEGRQQLAEMSAHWITNRLAEVPNAEVVNYSEALNDPNTPIAVASTEQREAFAGRTRAVNVLEGAIYRQGEELLFEAQFINLKTGETIERFDVIRAPVSEPMEGIGQLANEVQGWWASKDDNVYSTPTYESYQLYLRARDIWAEDRDRAKSYLVRSIDADESFIDPHFLLTEYFSKKAELTSNKEYYFRRDSMIDLISQRFQDFTPRLRALLDVYEADARGDLVRAYTRYKYELKADPYDLFVNTGGMVHAMEFVNNPDEVIRIYNFIPADSVDIEECVYCQTRSRLATRAFLANGMLDSALLTAQRTPVTSMKNLGARILPLIHMGDTAALNTVLDDAKPEIGDFGAIYPFIAWHFELLGNTALSNYYAQFGLSNYNSLTEVFIECNYLLGNYGVIKDFMQKDWPLPEFAQYEYVLQYYARVYGHIGTEKEQQELTDLLVDLDNNDPYDYGKYDYLLGVMESIKGNKDEAVEYLGSAYRSGYRFSSQAYYNDIDLKSLTSEPGYQRLLNPLE